MIVMSRMKGESIVIGDRDRQVEVQIVEIRGDKVRFGITGPENMSVLSRENWESACRAFVARLREPQT